MTGSRRDFIKFVLAGSAAATCPLDSAQALADGFSLLAAPAESRTHVDGEHYQVCHQVRDGRQFARPPVGKHCEVIIVGGGVSGLTAAYLLQSRDFLLLEKEPHWGGNAYLEEYDGQAYATGAAFEFAGEAGDKLASEIGLKLLPVNNPDPTIINGTWVPDAWRTGLDQLPYPASIRESFKKFRRDMLAMRVEQHLEQFDNEPLSKYCAGYAPEIQQWWDAYGASNWGGRSEESSAYVALLEFADIAGQNTKDDRVTLPGGLGAITKRLAEVVGGKHREQMVHDATVVAVEQTNKEVRVTYAQETHLHTAAAKAVIMATPKFITRHIVAGLPPAQADAMQQIRYIPYPVINLIFDKPVYNRGYDTWCPKNSFTDFVVADWVVRNQPGYHQKHNILSCYTPLLREQRERQLDVAGCRRIATEVLRDFRRLMPGFDVEPVEIHMYRRGHPMFMPMPGTYSKVIPAASHSMERIFFANADSIGPESLTSAAIVAAQRAAEWAEKQLS